MMGEVGPNDGALGSKGGSNRLAELAQRLATQKLTILWAPPGYGKTFALQRLHELVGTTTAAFLAVDTRDNDIDRFTSRLAAALGLPKLESIVSSSELSDMANAGGERLLFVDGLQEIDNPLARTLFNELVRFTPALKAAITVRVLDIPSLSRWRAMNQLEMVGQDMLALTDSEALALFAPQLKLEAYPIVERCRGWPMLLKLAVQGLEAGDPATAVGEMGTISGDLIADFVEEEILGSLEPDEARLLIETSLLSRFTAGLAQALLPDMNADAVLERLTRRHGLVASRRLNGLWFDVNPMMRSALLRRLVSEQGSGIRARHRLVERWMLEHDAADQALLHASSAGDYAQCSDMVRSVGPATLAMRYGLKSLRSVISAMPERDLMAEPSFAVSRALIYSKEGRTRDARRILSTLRAQICAPKNDGLSPATAADLDLLEVMLLCHSDQDHPHDLADRIDRIATELPGTDSVRRGWVENLQCRVHFTKGDFTAALAAGAAAEHLYGQSGSYYGQFFIHLHLASMRAWQDQWDEVAEQLDLAESLASRYFAADPTILNMVQLLRSEHQFEHGEDGDEHEQASLLSALELAENNDGWVDIFVSGYRTAAARAFRTGDPHGAFSIVRRGQEAAIRLNLPRLDRILRITQAEMKTWSGDRTGALHDLRHIRMRASGSEEHLDWREQLMLGVANARLLIHSNQFKRAGSLLDELEEECTTRSIGRIAHKCQLLRAILLSRSGRPMRALEAFAALLESGSNPPSLRSIVEEGEGTARLCGLITHRRQHRRLSLRAAERLERIGAKLTGVEGTIITPEAAVYLSSRGQEILLNLAEGRSNKEIANRLNVTEATVKFHLQGMYRKLGASNRVRAVALAKEQGLIY